MAKGSRGLPLRPHPSRRTRSVFPTVVLGPEGETEKNYIQALAAKFGLSVRAVDKDNQFEPLFSRVSDKTASLRREGVRVIPVILKDIEISSDAILKEHDEHLRKCAESGMIFVASCPFIERWLLLHFEKVSPNKSKQEILSRLEIVSERDNYNRYQKPWGLPHFKLLTQARLEDALKNCESSGHAPNPDYCMCHLVAVFRKFGRS